MYTHIYINIEIEINFSMVQINTLRNFQQDLVVHNHCFVCFVNHACVFDCIEAISAGAYIYIYTNVYLQNIKK